jgi:hypothetical protein
MNKEMPQKDSLKKTYAKPLLSKHGNLKEITGLAQKVGSSVRGGELGCTRW